MRFSLIPDYFTKFCFDMLFVFLFFRFAGQAILSPGRFFAAKGKKNISAARNRIRIAEIKKLNCFAYGCDIIMSVRNDIRQHFILLLLLLFRERPFLWQSGRTARTQADISPLLRIPANLMLSIPSSLPFALPAFSAVRPE